MFLVCLFFSLFFIIRIIITKKRKWKGDGAVNFESFFGGGGGGQPKKI